MFKEKNCSIVLKAWTSKTLPRYLIMEDEENLNCADD